MALTTGKKEWDFEKRHQQVLGASPRIPPLRIDEIDSESRELVTTVRASAGSGPTDNIPEYMRTMLRHPELFRRNMEMGTTIFKGLIPPRERELAVLRCGWLCGAPYEWGEHVIIGKRYGLTDEEVLRVIDGSDAEGWSEFDRAIIRGTEELIGDHVLSDASWETLSSQWSSAQMIEFPMMVGQYVATAYVQNSIRMRLMDHNQGLFQR